MSSDLKPTGRDLDVPLGDERRRVIELIGDRWTLWTVLAVHELDGARFTDLAAEPGLSRRVLAERLRTLVHAGLLETEQYQARPPRSRYRLSARGQQVRRLALALVHVAAGGVLVDDPLAPPRVHADEGAQVTEPGAGGDPEAHPADALLAGDLDAARRIHDDTVEPLVRYDDRYRTSLLDTLATWLACDASVSMAAARLYAHRHTVRYRLDRVRELTGLDPATTADRERLALGLRARRVLGSAGRLDAP